MPDQTSPLNAPTRDGRLAALRVLAADRARRGEQPPRTREVNCHVHTTYSFSPYSPAFAAERADAAGLLAVGIMDHDSVAGAAEMREAGRIIGIATTGGSSSGSTPRALPSRAGRSTIPIPRTSCT